MPEPSFVPISAIITTVDRINDIQRLLDCIERCVPRPAEILVHVDGASPAMLEALRSRAGNITVLSSEKHLGAGGSRNRLIQAAAHNWIASFDDDSLPLDDDYFLRVLRATQQYPGAAILAGTTTPEEWEKSCSLPIAVYVGNICVFNKEWFLRTRGFVPVPFAWAMEEVDLSLQLHALGGRIIFDTSLRAQHPAAVFSGNPRIEALIFCNTVLFPFLRYPVALWWMIPPQVLGRIIWLWRKDCAGAILPALRQLPGYLWRYRGWRRPVPCTKVLSWLRFRRADLPARS